MGKLDVENVRLAGLTAQEVAFKLRSQGVFSIRDVKVRILEQNGQLILTKSGEETQNILSLLMKVIQQNVLEVINKTEDWVLNNWLPKIFKMFQMYSLQNTIAAN